MATIMVMLMPKQKAGEKKKTGEKKPMAGEKDLMQLLSKDKQEKSLSPVRLTISS